MGAGPPDTPPFALPLGPPELGLVAVAPGVAGSSRLAIDASMLGTSALKIFRPK
jgi:hypothetical protein